ncbi:NAD(P)/FAD-dependent oxidoreductase [Deinococcus sp.]|uniref:NAD(P)/FAD-dependent oxidoreductase n=1 Tax=Deinococcus sp. TaxID=47478 RepID=UPI003B5C3C04
MTQTQQDMLIIGAGLAGLALARDLAQAGRRVQVLDKARGVSGRSSTRRLPSGASLDHGARFFTARHERTQAWIKTGLDAGWLAEWTRRIARWEDGAITQDDGHPRYVPPNGMNVLGRELARELRVELEAQVIRLERINQGWQAECQNGRMFTAQQLILNLPAPQIAQLLEKSALEGVDATPFSAVQFDPCWAVGAQLTADLAGVDWPALQLKNHPILDWLAREHTKRPPGSPPTLMLHAGADWTRAHLESERNEVTAALLDAARELVGPIEPVETFAQRWLYASPTERYPEAFGWQPELGLGWCGDWCTADEHGPRVEAALLSGWHLADRLSEGR